MLDVPLVDTPLNITVMRFTHDGIEVKSIEVPDVDATAVLSTLTDPLAVAAGKVTVLEPATVGTAKVTDPLVSPAMIKELIYYSFLTE